MAGINVTCDNPGGGQTWFTKTITFAGGAGTGAIGTVAVATVAGGAVVVDDVIGRVTTSLTGASATISLGTASQVASLIGVTTATGLTTTANLWATTTPTAGAIGVPALLAQGVYTVESIIINVLLGSGVTGGVLEIDFLWHPLTSGATLS